jgi:hypothetical protein
MIPLILIGGVLAAYLLMNQKFSEGPERTLQARQATADESELRAEITVTLWNCQRYLQQAAGDAVAIFGRVQAGDRGSSWQTLWTRRYSPDVIPAARVEAELYDATRLRLYPVPAIDPEIRAAIANLRRVINSSALPIKSDRWTNTEATATGIGAVLALTDASSLAQVADTLDRLYRWLWSCSFYSATGPLWGPYLRCGAAYWYWWLPSSMRVEAW